MNRTTWIVALCALPSCWTMAPQPGDQPANPAPISSLASSAGTLPPADSSPATPGAPPTQQIGQKTLGGCPDEMARVDEVCIDRWEAHLVVRDRKGAEKMHRHTERPPEQGWFAARSKPDTFPQAYLDRHQAKRACEAAGKRLCSVTEWVKACRGSANTQWPYGDSYVPGGCNQAKQHLLSILFGTNPQLWDPELTLNSPLLNKEPGYLAKSGAHSECHTDQGVWDMVGNLHEWVSDDVDATLEDKVVLPDSLRKDFPASFGHAIFMGGFYSSKHQFGKGCGYITVWHSSIYHDYSTGFRCCAAPVGT